MRIVKAFKFRIYPDVRQTKRLRAWGDALRFLWNLAHEQRLLGLSRCKGERIYPTAFGQMRELTPLRAELPWLADVPQNVCTHLLLELDKAWQRCFKRIAKVPRFKRKSTYVADFCESHSRQWRLRNSTLRFPKLGNLRAVVHRPVEGKPKTCTLKEEAGQWFAILICEIEILDPAPRIEPAIAIDRGVVNVVADSDGNLIESPRFYAKVMKKLARAQRTLSRRKKGSKNREKAKHRVAVIHRKVRRQRELFTHQISARLSKSHATVVVEKLQIDNMLAMSRGLARGILDAGWGMLARQLRYKLAWSGGALVEVPAAYSSQTCHGCGHIDAASRKTQAIFECVACGLCEHADLNAAKVLLQRFRTPGNPWCLPVDGSARKGPGRSRKRLWTPRRPSEVSPPLRELIT